MSNPEMQEMIETAANFRQYTDCGVTTLYQSDWTWAKDRITAGFVLDISELDHPYRCAMFFHGDNEDNYLFGASIGVVFGDDLHTWEITLLMETNLLYAIYLSLYYYLKG